MAGLDLKERINVVRGVYRFGPAWVIDCLTAARVGTPPHKGRITGATAHERATGATEPGDD
jgi:hypothetical protein